jgi:D-alanyl-D-alanine carboxypeptidase/D-alanyl-D-alanine-endopeptidase (penicillin-binding protein 4)
MAEVVKTMMKHSNNHFAEQIFVSVPAVKLGAGGYRSAKTMEEEFLKRAGINPAGVGHEDGSGLSEMNRVSPSDMCRLLAFMGTHKAGQVFFDSMPIGGRDGTLRGRMHSETVANRVHAKTGYINRVSCLSGYVALDPQRILAFSFLVNDIRIGVDRVKGTQDRLCEILSVLQP